MVAILRQVGRIWETAKVMGLILWPIRFILLVLLAMIFVLCLTQAKDALFGSVIEWTHPWLTLLAVSIWALLTWYWSRVLLDLPQKSGTDYLYTDPAFRDRLYQKFRLYIPRILGVVVFFIVGVFIRLSAIGSEVDGWLWLAAYVVCGIIFYALTAFRRLVINEIDEPSAPQSALKRSVAVVQRSVPAIPQPKQSRANEPATKEPDTRRMEAMKRAHRIEPLMKVDVLVAPEAGLKATGVFAIGWLVLLVIMASSAIWQWTENWREAGTIAIAVVLAIASIILVWLWRGEFHRKRIWAFCLSTLAGAAFFICSIARPARFGILLGPAVVLMLSAAMWVAASSVFLAFPGHRLRLPVTTFLIGSMLLFGAIPKWFVQSRGDHDNHAVRVANGDIVVDRRMTLLDSFDRWYQQAPCRLDENSCEKKPIVIVVLEGGASRSAYWSAMILGALQDALPEFHKRIFAISSVSGGSLGAAVYQRLVSAGLNGTAPTCGRFQGYAVCAQRVLQYDFLGASFFSMFTSDLLQRLAPGALLPDRAEALERAWERAWSAELKSGDFDQPLKIRFASSGNEKWLPVLLLNGSSVKTGRRIVTSDVALDVKCRSSDDSAELSTLPSAVDFFCLTRSPVRLSTAVHNSARFPYISPAGTIWATDGKGEPWKADRIVDGGYFEALGATTVSDLLIKLRKEHKLEKVEPIVLVVENDPTQHAAACSTVEADDVECRARELAKEVGEEAGTMSFRVRNSDDAVAPVIGLAASRTGRGTYAGRALEAELAVIGMRDRLVRFNLLAERAAKVDPAMSWYLSKRSIDDMKTDFCWAENPKRQVDVGLKKLAGFLGTNDTANDIRHRGTACSEVENR
jgi:hypothetical protein